MPRKNWSEDELLQLLLVYCKLPFGKMHSKNPEIIALAGALNRTPSAVALKMVNFASLDPTVGAKGMSNVSALDRKVWELFFNNIDSYFSEADRGKHGFSEPAQETFLVDDFSAEDVPSLVSSRRGQQTFRNAVLASYDYCCAISGLAEPRLLVASHIAPWASLKSRRLDPRNGVCLSALWDRAFDYGLISLTQNLELVFSDSISHSTRDKLTSMGSRFRAPKKFGPDTDLLAAHRVRFGFE